jgi:hypothetical protein
MGKVYKQVEAFKLALNSSGGDFICHTDLPATHSQVTFAGTFQGETVCWNMTIATLDHYRLTSKADKPAIEQQKYRCPFIEIAEGIEGVYPLSVGLDLPVIDEPVIKKAIIMIRNYKKLLVGKIEFGGTHT